MTSFSLAYNAPLISYLYSLRIYNIKRWYNTNHRLFKEEVVT